MVIRMKKRTWSISTQSVNSHILISHEQHPWIYHIKSHESPMKFPPLISHEHIPRISHGKYKRKFHEYILLPGLVNVYITNWKDPPSFFHGKINELSTGPWLQVRKLSDCECHYQRVNPINISHWITLKCNEITIFIPLNHHFPMVL